MEYGCINDESPLCSRRTKCMPESCLSKVHIHESEVTVQGAIFVVIVLHIHHIYSREQMKAYTNIMTTQSEIVSRKRNVLAVIMIILSVLNTTYQMYNSSRISHLRHLRY